MLIIFLNVSTVAISISRTHSTHPAHPQGCSYHRLGNRALEDSIQSLGQHFIIEEPLGNYEKVQENCVTIIVDCWTLFFLINNSCTLSYCPLKDKSFISSEKNAVSKQNILSI